MTGLERQWVEIALGSFAPPGAFAPTPGEVPWLETYERFAARSTPLAGFGMRLALWIFTLAPLWRLGRPRLLGSLPPGERAALAAALLRDRRFLVRELALLMKMIASMALFSAPRLRAQSRFDQGPLEAAPAPLEAEAEVAHA